MNDAPESTPNPSQTVPPVYYAPPPPRRRSLFGKLMSLLGCLVFVGSLFLNILLMVALSVQSVSIGGLQVRDSDVLQKGEQDQTVMVYRLEGGIDSDTSQKFRRFHNHVKDNDDVKAVVLFVDSPGGTVSDSEQIHHMIADLKRRGKTVVVSMGGLAASGGYYISAGADVILAEPTTITGSIGVISAMLNLEGTLDKVGMKVAIFKSTHAEGWKDMLSSFRDMQPREKKYLIRLLDEMQNRFEMIVRDGRGPKLKTRKETYQARVGEGDDAKEITKDETAPFNGKIYLADAAKEFGLVDEIGFLDDACKRAADLAGLSQPNVVVYRPHFNFFEALAGAKAPTVQIDAKSIQNAQTPQFLMLWKPEW